MPRYSAQNLAAVDPEYRKAHNIGSGGGSNNKKRRYAYGKQNNVLVASGNELLANGLCLRLLPIYDETAKDESGNREFVNFREGRDGVAFGDWSRLLTCAHWVGNPGVCFIVHDGNPDINLYDSPLHVLRKAAWDNKDNPGIGRLFSELLAKNFVKDSHIGTLKKPEKTLFISASTVFVNPEGRVTLGAFSDDEKKNARIIGLKTSALQALHSALSVRDESTGEFLSGDMLGLGASKLVTFLPESYISGTQNVIAVSAAGPATFQCPKFARSNNKDARYIVGYPQSRSDYTHYAVIHDTFQGQDVMLEPYMDRLLAETQSWDDYLWVPTYEEQAELLANAFPREALDFAWREYPQYLRAIPRNTATFDGAGVDVEDLEETHMKVQAPPAAAARRSAPAPQPAAKPDPVAPWDPQPVEGEISEEAAESVADLFSAPAAPVPPGATVPPPAAPAQSTAAPAPKRDSADILARARARASSK
jgi:hypothetical protein